MAMFPGQSGLANQGNMGLKEKQGKQGVGAAQFTQYDDSQGEVLYGLDKELADKAAAKYDVRQEAECRAWIEAVTGDKLEGTLQEALKNGIVLCEVVNRIQPGITRKPSASSMPFKQMEHISMYLDACTKLGVPAFSSFQTVALFENKDMIAVLNNIQALGSQAQKVSGYSGPTIGAKISNAAPRQFDAATLAAGKTATTFLGQGSHGQPGTQAGMIDRNKEINKMGYVQGADGFGSSAPTFLGSGSHGQANASGMGPGGRDINNMADVREKRHSGTFSSVAQPKRPSQTGPAISGVMAGSTGLANQSNMCRTAPNSKGMQGAAVFAKFDDNADAAGNVNYGLDADLAAKAAAKYDNALEAQCRMWIEAVTGDKMGECALQEELKDGIVLCHLVNAIAPGSTAAPSSSKMPFKQMENISMYLDACLKLGVPQIAQFQTVALFENKDMMAVLMNLQALGSQAQRLGFGGPMLGAKIATANRRSFTEEQLAAGLHTQTFLGTGSHGQANQAGMIDHSKNIDKMGHVAGCANTAGSAEATFLGTGSYGGATQAGMGYGNRDINNMAR